ncbi:cell cycle checkpoint protein RAD17-like [Scleropages formosus]|uniref:Cell cycle checkpoint protein RAD17-like n=1 Tax=Scleropages formosus TaxID=113540 RepID=A0A0P7WF42_SCLFO|nr:cell cycle checkpoint protein RAD17-like [Scleropages formosus]
MSKLPVEGKASSSKSGSWVEPSFGELCGGSRLKLPSSLEKDLRCSEARSRKTKTKTSSSCDSDDAGIKRKLNSCAPEPEPRGRPSKDVARRDVSWVDKHSPRTQVRYAVPARTAAAGVLYASFIQRTLYASRFSAPCLEQGDLAVHKKKIEEVETWLKLHTCNGLEKAGAILLLTGPSGCGKTATLQVLTRELGYQVQEWSNPCSVSEFNTEQSYLQTFDPGRCPLVLIVSDSLSGDGNSRLLIPKDIQEELGICNISFNPVAPTSMMKVLNRIVTHEASKSGGRISIPNKATLELLCTGSSGDIRNAINNLQFSFTDHCVQSSFWAVKKNKSESSSSGRGTSKARSKSKSAKASDKQDDTQAVGGRDVSLFLFRALGKILYCKRQSSGETWEPRLPAHLSRHHRDMLLVEPELVVEKSHMSAELFNLYLQQNYIDFFSDIDDVAQASEYLSDADFLTADWNTQATMRDYSSSVATRGVMYANSARARADSQAFVGFRPLHKPHWLLIHKKHRENCQAARSLFVSFCLTPVSLQTELLPYLAHLTNPMRNQDPGTLVLDRDELDSTLHGTGSTDSDFGPAEPVHKAPDSPKDVSSSQSAMADLPTSQPQPTPTQALMEEEEEEEEFVIEDSNEGVPFEKVTPVGKQVCVPPRICEPPVRADAAKSTRRSACSAPGEPASPPRVRRGRGRFPSDPTKAVPTRNGAFATEALLAPGARKLWPTGSDGLRGSDCAPGTVGRRR